jgi:hypothetical protein
MPPKAKVCVCTSHGCMDKVHRSQITGQFLKGSYLSDTEFRSHQRDENGFRLSGLSELLPQRQSMQSYSSTTLPSGAPPSPPLHTHLCSGPTSGMVDAEPIAQLSRQPSCVKDASLAHLSLTTQPEKPSGEDQDGLDPARPSADGHAPDFPAIKQYLPQGCVQGDPSAETPASQRGLTQEDRIMRAIEGCRFDFQSWQRADISSDELIFEETPSLEPPPHLPLRVDVLSNVGFIEYEETMFNLLDRIEKIKTGDYQQCDIAKRNIFSSVEDELHRLRGVKVHSWKRQAASASSVFPALRTGPFREIETCERFEIL